LERKIKVVNDRVIVLKGKKKVKFTLVQAMKAQMRNRGSALHFL